MDERKKIAFIVNPISGTHNKEHIVRCILLSIDKRKYQTEFLYTEYAGHATELARQKNIHVVPFYVSFDGVHYKKEIENGWNNSNKYFTISGYLIIYDVDNENKEYEVVLKDKNSDKEYSVKVESWTKDTPYDLGEVDGNSYTESWFKGKIDLSEIPNGDYDLYMKAT